MRAATSGTKRVHGLEQLFGVVALGDDPYVVFEGENAGRTRAKDSLIVSQNKSVHRMFSLLL